MKILHHLTECNSTNDEIINFVPSILQKEDLVGVYTLSQTRGKGQYGNSWEINPNENIAISMAVSLDKFPFAVSIINYYTAIIVRDFIANLTQIQPKIKWPNDIILNQKKISGILLEKKNNCLVIGIGINVLQQNFERFPKAGSIYTQTHRSFEPHLLAKEFFEFFANEIAQPKTEIQVLEILNNTLFKKNEVCVFDIKGVRQNGIIRKADAEGYLWIELEDERLHRFYHKEIQMLY
ncbi:biotin--[acetyl-CoA-carboxylase] ligase [Riemerella anatipestifer]|uniref:biotin--[acetyl-CoA-carboxylase] ligase n=1 Tax=Riemerella anatipestifer TaxID=34085 RepID=UPI000D6944AC|nr:biotin--[acetyl-CoA-carboxylase] ligase [Riemerella anatipestifer]MRM85712.1 biotin--[acetyl-CoA-carboxylase] ligase [Riemerella anatipestifer]MRM94640.1 biotin--[acetyl-CoA-carboxylase] ligase [Riemerella anatipestifer]WPC11839.1 biotin--[acetyl-CoA-carboxylase] ligase [Riemerella anatipestifer]WPC12467.1 biotin--[acetyl-CoA-carboxylase] ligase [Riemerella anatipestifer]WPC15688.1 biotin--[acetyl-CoA-carboxylase] ligase [Riemerella anatipestifer]